MGFVGVERVPVKEFGVTPCGFWENCGVGNGGFAGDEYVPEYPTVQADVLCLPNPAAMEDFA